MTTNGSNIRGLWEVACGTEEPLIEEDDVYSNDIYAILMTFGVEMARAAIVREMSRVFGVYNIDVDIRHLELIADYMVSVGMISLNLAEIYGVRRSRVATTRSTARELTCTRRLC
jgi:RNA polymerase Rpb1, domain 5